MIRAALATGLLSGAAVVAAVVGEPAPQAQIQPAAGDPDWVVAHNARRTLWSDPALAELNLGVRVRDGEALIWGPVPTDELAAEAVARLKLVRGVRAVVSELYILPADDVLRMRLRPAVKKPQLTPAAINHPPADGIVARLERPQPVRAIPSRLIDIVEELRGTDRRFRFLTAEVANGVVTVIGTADRPAEATEFAEACRRLSGVSNVVVRLIP